MNFSDTQKAELVEEARALYRRLWPDDTRVRDTRACLFHAVALQCLLKSRYDFDTMLQAGTCQWPMLAREDDDGECATHFAYQWNGLGDLQTVMTISEGAMPEMHVWLGTRNPDTIIDPTTGTWQARAREGGYERWTAPAPPAFLWVTVDELMNMIDSPYDMGITYLPHLDACKVASMLAGQEIYPGILKLLAKTRKSVRRG